MQKEGNIKSEPLIVKTFSQISILFLAHISKISNSAVC